MDFCVLVKISKRTISFWYQTGKSLYAPLIINETNHIPLCFYVNGNDFIFGDSAKSLFYSHDPNAYGNYFDIIKDPSKHFVFYGIKKPVKQLLYYGIEQYLSFFINTVLYKSDSIESFRQNFPLRFYFDTDIEEKEKSLIVNIFAEAGYDNVESIDFKHSLIETLQSKNLFNPNKNILLLTGIDNTLYLDLFKSTSWDLLKSLKIEGLGADPRVKILADMIIDYVSTQNPHLSLEKESEIGHILPFVAGLLENYSPILKGEIEVIDGNKYWFTIKSRNLEERLLYANTDTQIYSAVDELLKSLEINVENTVIILGSEEISTPFFSSRLLKKYSSVISLESPIFEDAFKLIFSKISSNGYKSIKRTSLPPQIPNALQSSIKSPAIPEAKAAPISEVKVPSIPEIKPPSLPNVPTRNATEKIITAPSLPNLPPNSVGEKKNVSIPNVPTIPKMPEINKAVEEKKKVGIPAIPPLPPKK